MQFQYLLLAIMVSATQVLAVPTTETKAATELTEIPDGTRVTSALLKSDSEVVADACYDCGYPCGGYYCCNPLPVCRYFSSPLHCVCANF